MYAGPYVTRGLGTGAVTASVTAAPCPAPYGATVRSQPPAPLPLSPLLLGWGTSWLCRASTREADELDLGQDPLSPLISAGVARKVLKRCRGYEPVQVCWSKPPG